MPAPFPPPLGTRVADRFDLLAPLRGDGPTRTFLAYDQQTSRRSVLSLFDPARTTPAAWAEYLRITSAASAAKTPGLALPLAVPDAPPPQPHVVEDPPANRTLDRVLTQHRRLPWQRAITLGERVAATLQAALATTQAAHRALTPYRITVDAHDEVQLLDHGIAEFIRPGDPEDPDYRAPEQKINYADTRADIYTLALILHELISGARPTGTPPPHLDTIPPALEALLAQALAPDPAQRPDLPTLRASLREHLGLPALASPPPAAPQPTAEPPPATVVLAPAHPAQAEPAPAPHAPTRPSALDPWQPNKPAPRTTPPSVAPTLQPPADRTEILPARPDRQDTTDILPIRPPPRDTTNILATRPPIQDTTDILPTHDDPATVQLALPPTLRSRPPVEEPPEDHTSVFIKSRHPRAPAPDRTEILPSARASDPPVQLDRTEALPNPRTPTPVPTRTEPLDLPTQQNLRRLAPLPPTPPRDPDDDRTIARPIRLPAKPRLIATDAPTVLAQPIPLPQDPPTSDPTPSTPPEPQPSPAALRTLIILTVVVALTLVATLLNVLM